MASGKFANVLVEPHQQHVVGQSDLETALHTLLDHLREPFTAVHGPATDFLHVFNKSHYGSAHKPKNAKGGYARIFAPKIDIRETTHAYYIDIELPGVRDTSSFCMVWRSDRELVVEGAVERPVLSDILSLNAHADSYRNGVNGSQQDEMDCNSSSVPVLQNPSSQPAAPAYVVADEANGFEKNEDFSPQSAPQSEQPKKPLYVVADEANGFEPNEDLYPADFTHSKARSQANPFLADDDVNKLERMTEDRESDLFPLDIVDGMQLDEGDRHRVKVPMHHLPNGDEVATSRSSVTIGERNVGRFMRCFVFPHPVDVQGLRSEIVDGLLRIGVPKE